MELTFVGDFHNYGTFSNGSLPPGVGNISISALEICETHFKYFSQSIKYHYMY